MRVSVSVRADVGLAMHSIYTFGDMSRSVGLNGQCVELWLQADVMSVDQTMWPSRVVLVTVAALLAWYRYSFPSASSCTHTHTHTHT